MARREKPSASRDPDTKLIDGFLKLCATVDKLESKLLASPSAPADDDDCATEGTLPDAADMFAALSEIVNLPVSVPSSPRAKVVFREALRMKDIALRGTTGGNLNKLRERLVEWERLGKLPAGELRGEHHEAAHDVASNLASFFNGQLDVRDALSHVFALKDADVQDARCEAIKARGEAQLANLKLGVYEAAMERIEFEEQWRCSVCDGVVFANGDPDDDAHNEVNDSGEAHDAEWQNIDDSLLVERFRQTIRDARDRFKATVVK